MSEVPFPYSAETVVATVAELFRHQGNANVVEILETADGRIEETEYDNWNGGTYYYSLLLEIPLKLYARIEDSVGKVEKIILAKIQTAFKNTGSRQISQVVVSPVVHPATLLAGSKKVPEVDVEHLWAPGFLRLFLSHVAVHKVQVTQLKNQLLTYGVSGFVAHEDIEPNLEWQREIERALASMHALAALLTPGCRESAWVDQEIGFALGRQVLVIPVKLGLDPYGFIGKDQGLSATLNEPSILANRLVDILLAQKATAVMMRDALVTALERAPSFADSKAVSLRLSTLGQFTDTQLDRVEAAVEANFQVSSSFGVPERVKEIVRQFRPEPKAKAPF
jgi:TIR domain